MKSGCGVAASAGLALMWVSNASAGDASIPDSFHGIWEPAEAGQTPGCAANNGDIRIKVGSRRIDLHEGICEVQAVAPRSGDALQIRTYCEQEDSDWAASEEWALQQSGGQQYLVVTSLDPDNEYSHVYGSCTGRIADASAGDENVGAGETPRSYCYREGMSELKLTTIGDGMAEFEVMSAQGNAHICALSGQAVSAGNGYRYTEQIDGGGLCDLSIIFGNDDSVRLTDADWNCKQFYCGQRASFEHIEFGPNARVRCD